MLEIDNISDQDISTITDNQRKKLDEITTEYQQKYDQNEMMVMLNKIEETRKSNKEISDFTQLMWQYLLTQWITQLAQ